MPVDVEFDEEDPTDILRLVQQRRMSKKKVGMITQLALRTGIAKNEKEAQYVLLGLAAVLGCVAIIFYLAQNPVNTASPETQSQLLEASFGQTP
jgi:hypothetical protein